jgi:hypothetical protein
MGLSPLFIKLLAYNFGMETNHSLTLILGTIAIGAAIWVANSYLSLASGYFCLRPIKLNSKQPFVQI